MVRDHWIEEQMDFLVGGGDPHSRECMATCLGQAGLHDGGQSVPGSLSATHLHPTQPGPPLSLELPACPSGRPQVPETPVSARSPSLKPHLHQAAAFALGAHKQPRGEAGDLKREDAVTPSADTQGGVAGRGEGPPALPPKPWSRNTHRRGLQKLLVGRVQFESFLVVQVGGSQGDGEVDAAGI